MSQKLLKAHEPEIVDKSEPEPEVGEPFIETFVHLPAEPTMEILSLASYDVFLIPEIA